MLTRDALIGMLGPLPHSVDHQTTVLEEVDCGSYVRQTIEYGVEPDERIKAFLCRPHSVGRPLAGVYCFHQHGGNRLLGKSEVAGMAGDPDQAYAAELAERGFIRSAFRKGVLDFEVFPGGNQFSQNMRQRAYAFLAKHLES